MFSDLSSTVRLAESAVEVRLLCTTLDYSRPIVGGLTLVPTLWTRNASAPISPDEPPMILYAARGVATLWEPQVLPAPRALANLIGATRAGLLVHLETPASSTDLAARLGVTTTAVNQHLSWRVGRIELRDGHARIVRRA